MQAAYPSTLLAFFASLCVLHAAAFAAPPPFTSIPDIREFGHRLEAAPRAVALDATVIYAKTEGRPDIIVHDGTAGIYLIPPAAASGFMPGRRLRIRGTALIHHFAPAIRAHDIVDIGSGPLPEPRVVTFGELLQGRDEAQFVELRGVVRSAKMDTSIQPQRLLMELACEGGRIRVWILNFPNQDPGHWVDARVAVRGVALHFAGFNGQLQNRRLLVQQLEDVRLLRPASEPFDAPRREAWELLRFSTGGFDEHRIRVEGIATLQVPGEVLYLDCGKVALRVHTRQATPVQPGDHIEVSGFASPGIYHPQIEDAVFRIRGRSAPSPPIELSEDVDEFGMLDGSLVTFPATFTESIRTEEGRLFIVSSGNRHIRALLAADPDAPQWLTLRPGSRLRLTGICEPSGEPELRARGLQPRDFLLRLRTSADVELIKQGPWWTPGRLRWAIILAGLGYALAALWLASLGRRNRSLAEQIAAREHAEAQLREAHADLERRVQVRSAQLAQQIRARHDAAAELEAVMGERHRLAADLHDSLEQALAGAAIQIELIESKSADTTPALRRHCKLARALLEQSREEARRSVWDLRARPLEENDLSQALREIGEVLTEGSTTRFTLTTNGEPRRLSGLAETHLFRAAQEALTNAIKHARASCIEVEIHFLPESIRVDIRDDGGGFDPLQAPLPSEGHFGLSGIRERLRRMGGVANISSTPGRGTRVSLSLPEPAITAAPVS